ncbi:hypothetical protein CONLIGDRAFT_687635 [Coniochaeta ligniaria NRRL 30616]|uniref:Uncharacterized protein n=1 Tax=Coniochaeta ligniaria NRRL 30616 TaxID=1408157 RepID=A0A1J7I4D2_9PEZI|nr:hypothetical protein CONLIGDRAFT_687635 [Coniochaeta ligniaria NRRL 30616]
MKAEHSIFVRHDEEQSKRASGTRIIDLTDAILFILVKTIQEGPDDMLSAYDKEEGKWERFADEVETITNRPSSHATISTRCVLVEVTSLTDIEIAATSMRCRMPWTNLKKDLDDEEERPGDTYEHANHKYSLVTSTSDEGRTFSAKVCGQWLMLEGHVIGHLEDWEGEHDRGLKDGHDVSHP